MQSTIVSSQTTRRAEDSELAIESDKASLDSVCDDVVPTQAMLGAGAPGPELHDTAFAQQLQELLQGSSSQYNA